jgi:hypothetical protein
MHSKSNFGQLRVSTSGVYGDAEQLAAAGFLEGYLTAERVCVVVGMHAACRTGCAAGHAAVSLCCPPPF